MRTETIIAKGIDWEVTFELIKPEPEVGLFGAEITIYAIKIGDADIIECLNEETLSEIADGIYDRYNEHD
ncbi:MAG: hypothetical protein WC449_05825 [Candidatus Paceibacterota bacterium]